MSEQAITLPGAATPTKAVDPAIRPRSILANAKMIGALTLVSRILGMLRESVSANYFGARTVLGPFVVAFSIPNLFRKLFGEGALSAAFIPLYAQAIRNETPEESSRDFAAASVNLLCLILLAITIVGELVIWTTVLVFPGMREDILLTFKFTGIMLPYVLLICGTAFLSSILQVHKRFAAPAATPIVLNLTHIVVMVIGARLLHLHTKGVVTAHEVALQTKLAYWLCFFVLVAGVLQAAMLWPSLRAVGFEFRWVSHVWTPRIKRMLRLSVPVGLGAGVLQISVIMDKWISMVLAARTDRFGKVVDHFNLFGHAIRYPMEMGAAARLNWAQFLYQFPLGIFAIALATAIFPGLSADALDENRDRFRSVMRTGIEATLFEGLAASIGLIVVRHPAIRLLFQHGPVTAADADLIARSVIFYSSAIWAFSLLQITNRAYYALHDTRTPLVLAAVNIIVNLVVELPLVWVRSLGEAGMAVGTCASFIVQALVMLWMLDRKVGGLGLSRSWPAILKMIVAALVMWGACWLTPRVPGYPHGGSLTTAVVQLALLMGVGGAVYVGTCSMLGFGVLEHVLPRRKK